MTIFSPAWRPYLAGLLAALLWAGNFVVGKSARVDFPPVTLALARWLIALLVLTPFVYSGLRHKLAPLWHHKRTVLVLAFAGVSVTNTFVYIGLGHTSATNGVLMNAALPAWVMLISAGLGQCLLTRPNVAGLVVSLFGVWLLVGHGAGLAINPGDGWVAAGMMCWALYTVFVQRLPAGVNRFALLWLLMLIGLLPLLPFALMEGVQGQWHQVGGKGWLSVLYIAVGPSLLAMLAYDMAIKKLGAYRAGQFINLVPVFGALLSTWWLGEHISLLQVSALLLILSGMVVCNLPWQQLALQRWRVRRLA